MLIMVKYVILGLFMLGRDLNNGFIRMIIINISDVEKRFVICENKKNGLNLYYSCWKDVGFLKINFFLFLYLCFFFGRILYRWFRNWCSKWIVGEKRFENVISIICNEFLVWIYSVVVFFGY